MNYLETTTATFPSSPEFAFKFCRLKGEYMSLSKGNIFRCALYDRKPAEDAAAFWSRLSWTSELLWCTSGVGKEVHTQVRPGTKKDPMALFLRRKCLDFAIWIIPPLIAVKKIGRLRPDFATGPSSASFFDIQWFSLSLSFFSLHVLILIPGRHNFLHGRVRVMLFVLIWETRLKQNTTSAILIGKKFSVYRQTQTEFLHCNSRWSVNTSWAVTSKMKAEERVYEWMK